MPSDFLMLMDFWPIFFCSDPENISSGLGEMLFLMALDISKTKIIRTSEYETDMIMKSDWIPATGTYDTVK